MKRPDRTIVIPFNTQLDKIACSMIMEWCNYADYLESEVRVLKRSLQIRDDIIERARKEPI